MVNKSNYSMSRLCRIPKACSYVGRKVFFFDNSTLACHDLYYKLSKFLDAAHQKHTKIKKKQRKNIVL